jgi:hypothetical protein
MGAYSLVVDSGGRPDVCWRINCACDPLERSSWAVARLRYKSADLSQDCLISYGRSSIFSC